MTLIALVLVSHLYDLSTFLACVRVFPIEDEGNPVARSVYEGGGDIGVVMWKVILMVLFLGLAYMARSEFRRDLLWFAAVLGLIGGLVNTASLLTLP